MDKLRITVKPSVEAYQLYLLAALSLRNANFGDKAYELLRRGQEMENTEELNDLILEYVDFNFTGSCE